MHTEIHKKCAYFVKSIPSIPSRLDLQLVNTGHNISYSNVYLSDSFLVDFLWDFCEKNGGFTRILNKHDSDVYYCHIFTYALKSFGKPLTHDLFTENTICLSYLEHKLAVMLYYHIQNPSDKTRKIISLQVFEYFRSLILTKMSSPTQLLLMSCVFI